MSTVISDHVCNHWNYRVCFIEDGKCKNCSWITPDEQDRLDDIEEAKIKIKDPCDCVIQPCEHYDGEYMENNEYFDGEVSCIICGGEPDNHDSHGWNKCKCPNCDAVVKSLKDQDDNHAFIGYKNPETGEIREGRLRYARGFNIYVYKCGEEIPFWTKERN